MKPMLTAILVVLLPPVLQAQETTADSCACSAISHIKFPGNYNGPYGTVIIEFEVDSVCFYSNPAVIKSVSRELGEAALATMKDQIGQLNRCRIKCEFRNCKKEKLKQPFSFCPDD